MSKRKSNSLESTAYHEAGHVVIAHLLKRKFRRASIVPDPATGSLGHVHFSVLRGFNPDINAGPITDKRIHNEILIDLAGIAAEARLTGRRNWRGAGPTSTMP